MHGHFIHTGILYSHLLGLATLHNEFIHLGCMSIVWNGLEFYSLRNSVLLYVRLLSYTASAFVRVSCLSEC